MTNENQRNNEYRGIAGLGNYMRSGITAVDALRMAYPENTGYRPVDQIDARRNNGITAADSLRMTH
jgi:hypothetical protein